MHRRIFGCSFEEPLVLLCFDLVPERIVLFVSGLVEGFVTPSPLPTWAKIAIGALVLAAYWTYTLVLGGRAVRAGEVGDLSEDDAGASVRSA